MNEIEQILSVTAMMRIIVGHMGGNFTLNHLLILAAVWEADLKGDSLVVSDVAKFCNVPSSTASSMVARLSNVTANGMGLITFDYDPVDRRRKFVRPSRRLKTLAKAMKREYGAYTYRGE